MTVRHVSSQAHFQGQSRITTLIFLWFRSKRRASFFAINPLLFNNILHASYGDKKKITTKKRKTKIRLCSKDRSSTFYTFLTPFLVGYKVLWQQSEAVKAKPHLKFGSFVLLLDIKEMASNWNSYGKEIWNQSIMQISYLHKQNINEVWFST